MLRKFLIIVFALICFNIYSEDSQDRASIIDDSSRFIDSRAFRPEGSETEIEIIQYIKESIQSMGLTYQEEFIEDKIEGLHSFSRNISVFIQGQSNEEFVLVLPLDNYDHQESASVNISVALAFLWELSLEKPEYSVHVLFTGGDRDNRSYLGSSLFIKSHKHDQIAALVYMNLHNLSKSVEIIGGSTGFSSPLWILELMRQSLEQSGISTVIDSPDLLINKSGLETGPYPIRVFLAERIPSIQLISSLESDSFTQNQSSRMVDSLLLMLDEIGSVERENWDRNYLYIARKGDVLFVIPELLVLFLFIGLMSLIMIPPLFQERRIYLNYRKFRHQIWMIPILVYLSFIFFMVSTLILEELLLLQSSRELWKQYPLYFLFFKLLSSLFLSSLFINMLRGLPFPRNPHFYSYIAFFISFINLLIVTYFSLTFSPIMLISLFFVYLFVSTRSKEMKRLFVFLSIVPQLIVLIFLFSRDFTTVYEFFLLSRVKGNWILSLFSLPLICMISSLSFYHHHYNRSRQEVRTVFVTFLLGLATVLIVYFTSILQPYSEGFRQNAFLVDSIDLDSGTREISISSSSDIGTGVLKNPTQDILLDNIGTSMQIKGIVKSEPLKLEWTEKEFLDRKMVDMLIDSDLMLQNMTLKIKSKDDLLLYDSPFPYEINPDSKSAEIFIGLYPPLPLAIPIILAKGRDVEFLITASNTESSYDLILDDKTILIQEQTIIKKSFTTSTDQ